MKNKVKASGGRAAMLIFAVICFVNPNINIVDIIPDFIGAFIIAKYLSYPADRVPYLAEARIAFLKLGLTSLFKIPAFLVMTSIRSTNVSDNDIVALFVFAFAVCEMLFFVIAIQNLFLGLFYLGERSDIPSLIAEFELGGKSGKRMNPEGLRLLLIVFTAVKLISATVPELFLLTKGVDSAGMPVMNAYSAYPYALVLTFFIALAAGIYTAKRAVAYIRAISSSMDIYSEADRLITPEIASELSDRLTVKELSYSITLIAVASLFVLEIREGSMKEINLIPNVIFILLMLYAFARIRDRVRVGRGVFISGGISAVTVTVRQIVEGAFLDTHGYTALVFEKEAKAAYIPTIVISAIELIAVGVFLVFAALVLTRLIMRHTGVDPTSEKYSRFEAARHTSLKRLVFIYAVGGILLFSVKLLNVIFKYFSYVRNIVTGDGIAQITMSMLPWFGSVLFAVSVVFILYTFFISSRIKDEIVFSYGNDGKL